MEGVPNFKYRSRDPDDAHFWGKFITHWLEHVMVNMCTKYEVSSFGNSKDIRGSQNFENGHVPKPRPIGVKFSNFYNGLHAVY